jgi:hypothetical protein
VSAAALVQGRRVETWAELFDTPGGYLRGEGEDGSRTWHCKTPNGHLGNLSAHEVEEHADGTITVSPSILVSDHRGELWHGFLERGVWREA